MKILVTGSNGQLGRELRNVLEASHPGITTYTDVEELDITDSAATHKYIKDGEFTHIINCAAYTAVDKAEEDKMLCAAINIDGVANLAKASAETGAKIIHISTDYVFDGKSYRPYKESDKVNPLSHYGSTKRKGETSLLGLAPNSIIIRTGWLFSPYGKNFVKSILALSETRPELNVVTDQVGTPTYAHDLAKAIETILFARQWYSGIVHFSNEGVCSWYDFAIAICKKAGKGSYKINPILSEDYPTSAIRPFYSVLDKSKFRGTYSQTIPHWETALEHCMARIATEEN